MAWPPWMRFSLRSLLLSALLLGSVLSLNHNWDAWVLERKLLGHSDDVRSAAFSRDGKRVISVSMDGTTRVWDAASGSGTVVWRANTISVLAAASFSPDGKRVVIAGVNDSVVVVALDQSTPPESIFNDARHGFVNCAAFSSDGKYLLTVFPDATAWIFDSVGPYKVPSLTLPVQNSLAVAAAWSPDGKFAAISDSTGTRLYDAQTGARIAFLQFSEEICHSVFSPDGKSLLLTTLFGAVRVWNLTALTVQYVELISDSEWRSDRHHSAEFSPDGARALECHTHVVSIWNLEGAVLTTLSHQFGVNTATYSPDGSRIVTTSEDGIVRIWRNQRPEEWWGIAWRPEAWLTVFFAIGLCWSLLRDWNPARRIWLRTRSYDETSTVRSGGA